MAREPNEKTARRIVEQLLSEIGEVLDRGRRLLPRGAYQDLLDSLDDEVGEREMLLVTEITAESPATLPFPQFPRGAS